MRGPALAASGIACDAARGLPRWEEPLTPLADGEVHVWQVALSVPPVDLSQLSELLSPEELARAGRFRLARDRDRFIAARAVLRRLLARYTGERAECVSFTTGPFGKPRLDAQPGASRVEFNLSHSGSVALCAVAEGRRVGIDIETLLSIAEDDERLSRVWLSEGELAEMASMSAADRTRTFHALWTRKEAYLKARGEGLSLAPDRVQVCGDRVLSESGVHWSLRQIPLGPRYAAALAVEGECDALSIRQWIGPPFALGEPT